MGEVIAFFAGAIAGVALTCIAQINRKNKKEDDEQMEYLKGWKKKHANDKESDQTRDVKITTGHKGYTEIPDEAI